MEPTLTVRLGGLTGVGLAIPRVLGVGAGEGLAILGGLGLLYITRCDW